MSERAFAHLESYFFRASIVGPRPTNPLAALLGILPCLQAPLPFLFLENLQTNKITKDRCFVLYI